MRIFFILKQMGYARHFTSTVRLLAERGHTVRLAAQDGEQGLPAALQGVPQVSVTTCASKRGDQWQDYLSLVRRTSDYLRYLTPQFCQASKLRARAFEKLVSTLSNGQRALEPGWADLAMALSPDELGRLRRLLAMIEETIPPSVHTQEFLQREAPDLVLITPLIDIGSSQADYVRACRALGIPCAMVLFSWDNLSTKGLIHEIPDQIFLWNELQVREAIELHQVPRDRLTVTGAPRFDEFIQLKPATDRLTFCRDLGLDPGQPIVVYLGSSKFVAEHEEPFIREWLAFLRSHPQLRGANVLVKPHPDVNRDWGEEGDRVRWATPDGEMRIRVTRPFDLDRVVVTRSTFTSAQFLYDCLHHSVAVVGLNTSAEIEAAIVGRPVLTVKAPVELADGQDGTLHFRYLLAEEEGFVQYAGTLEEHGHQLARAVAGDVDTASIRRFVETFIRPAGIDKPAGKVLVRGLERLLKEGRGQAQERPIATEPAVDAAAEITAGAADGAATDIVDLDYPAIRIRLRATSKAERQWRAHSCRKEPWTVAWLERVIGNGSVLYDIGANVGAFTLIAARRHATATVVAFEPGYASFAHLCDNLVLNQCQGNVIPIPLPLWSSAKVVCLKYRDVDPGQSRHGIRERAPRRKDVIDRHYEQSVLTARLDDLVRTYGLPPPTAIKLDVDGGEVEVLKGAVETLRSPSLTTLLVEIDRELVEPVTGQLADAGFRQVSAVDRGRTDVPAYIEFGRA